MGAENPWTVNGEEHDSYEAACVAAIRRLQAAWAVADLDSQHGIDEFLLVVGETLPAQDSGYHPRKFS